MTVGNAKQDKRMRERAQALASWLRAQWLRGLSWSAGLLVAYAVAGFFVAPLLLRPALERNLSAALNRSVRIARRDINPFTLSATLRDVVIADRGEGPPLLTLAEVYVNGGIASLFRSPPSSRR